MEGRAQVRMATTYCTNVVVMLDGTLYEAKVSRTVWVGGKLGDLIEGLPIDILPTSF